MTLSIKNGRSAFLTRLDLMLSFYVIMKRVPIATNSKQPIYQTINQSNLI